MENSETQVWLDFSFSCKLIPEEKYNDLFAKSEEIGRMLHHMISNPTEYLTQEEKKKLRG